MEIKYLKFVQSSYSQFFDSIIVHMVIMDMVECIGRHGENT